MQVWLACERDVVWGNLIFLGLVFLALCMSPAKHLRLPFAIRLLRRQEIFFLGKSRRIWESLGLADRRLLSAINLFVRLLIWPEE